MQIFVSYAPEDVDFTKRLVADMRKRGGRFLFDVTDAPQDDEDAWHDWIDDAAQSGDALLLIVSADAFQKKFIEDDWILYQSNGRPIIGAMERRCQLPDGFSPTVDFSMNYDSALHRLQLLFIEEATRLSSLKKSEPPPDE